jgi:hypothetical protein
MHGIGNRICSARHAGLAGGGLLGAFLSVMVLAPQARAASCDDLQANLRERRDLVSAVQAMTAGGKRMEPNAACTAFGKLAANGSTTLEWAEDNKGVCKVPDKFIGGLKADHDRVVKMRERACAFAAKLQAMPKWDLSRGWIE